MAVEEAFPSFSTERIRSKVQQRSEGPVTQRRLNYNAPLLSVRRRANAGHRDATSKVWKLSAELSKEPLRVPGAVPFTWEQTPGQPKQPESPPRPPSSPSPPSTPSPPSARRASPASPMLPPAPPPLRPLFLRTSSETLFAPPPPPPPPPPPLPRVHRLPLLKPRSVYQPPPYSGAPRPPPPPPPPPPLPDMRTRLNVRTVQPSSIRSPRHGPDPERMGAGAFCLVDPTEELLRVLRARREKVESQEHLTAEAATDEVEEKRRREVILNAEEEEESTSERTSKHGLFDDGMAHIDSIDDKTNCVAVDAIVQRFLEEHPGAAAEEAASPERQEAAAWKKDNEAGIDAVSMSPDPLSLQGNLDILQKGKNTGCDAINDPITSMAIPGSGLTISYSDEAAAEAEHKDEPQHDLATESVPSHARETGGPMSVSGVSPSMADMEVQQDAGHKQKTLMKEQQNRRRRSNVAILDTCRIESLQMLKSAILHLCRRAAASSLGTLNKAKRKIAAFRHTQSPRPVVGPRNTSRALNECRSDREEEVVASEAKMAVQGLLCPEVQERSSQDMQQPKGSACIPHSPPRISRRSSNGIVEEGTEIILGNGKTMEENRVCTPVSSPNSSTQESPHHERNGAQRKETVSSLPHQKEVVSSSSSHQNINKQGSPGGLQPSEVDEVLQPESRSSSARHVYAKSLGGDEPNEFYDASSRFGSRPSTPSRLYSNRSMSRDWPNLDEFSDATSTPFGSPRTSVSIIRYGELNAENSVVSPSKAFGVDSCTRPASKLSKRVGKSLWVETREVRATGTGDAVNMDELKGRFASRELLITSNDSGPASDITEKNCASRKCVSAEQASSSKVDARRQHRQRTLNNGKGSSHASHPIAVTPVYPSKCQKNRLIASASGLPRQISTGNMADVGWPLGISGYPPKTRAKAKEVKRERGTTKEENNVMVPLPPLPACPAGGSWLRKALSSSTQNQAPSQFAGLHAKKVEFRTSLGNKWEDIVKGSHIQPGHLRFSEELHHRPVTVSTTNKYYVS